MNSYLPYIGNLCCTQLQFSILILENTRVDAWIGAVIRNNLLYAAEQIKVDENSTLFSRLAQLPLAPDHPLHKEMAGGFPKGFIISIPPVIENPGSDTRLNKNEKVTFTLTLSGDMVGYARYFVEAVRWMCERGFGKPMVSSLLLDVYEVFPDRMQQVFFSTSSNTFIKDPSPVFLSGFDGISRTEPVLRIRYEQPVLLYQRGRKKDHSLSYQNKLNGFPSFYQLMRSVAFRLLKLTALYSRPEDVDGYLAAYNEVDSFLEKAAEAILLSANIQRYVVQSSRKKGIDERISLPGYIGETVFEGDFEEYIPLLHFSQSLGAGKDTNYGLGSYTIVAEND